VNALASEIGPASAPIERARAAHYLHPGGLVATREATRVTTILGSCVSVCLWDQRLGYGGVNHYLLPHWARSSTQSPHCYGNLALNGLLEALLALGCRRERLLARVYGGACVLDAFRGRREHLGQMNVTVARRFLDGLGIPVIDEHVGGARGRKLAFSTDDGSAELRLL
jgi:chemotaxis protein CheD